jgi:flagellar motor switch/type III secretory pathway protein FliN
MFLVNGKFVAKGEVVVIERVLAWRKNNRNCGIRIIR